MKKVSVIVPIYNVEKYLPRCIDSILNQSYSNTEIILVNDGSNDNSENICKKYKKRDSRIIYLYKQNGGLSDARNYGIRHATGDYLCFIDSDDYIHPKFIEVLINSLLKNNTRITSCLYKKVTEEKMINFKTDINENVLLLSKKDALKKLLEYKPANIISNHITLKLFDKNLFENIEFPVGKNFEDIGTFYLLLDKVDKISIVPEKLYFYYCRENSITKNMSLKSIKDKYDLIEIRSKFLIEKYNYIIDNVHQYSIHSYINLIKELIKKEGRNVLSNNLYNSIRIKLLCLKIESKLSLSEKLIYVSIKLNSKFIFSIIKKMIGGV